MPAKLLRKVAARNGHAKVPSLSLCLWIAFVNVRQVNVKTRQVVAALLKAGADIGLVDKSVKDWSLEC